MKRKKFLLKSKCNILISKKILCYSFDFPKKKIDDPKMKYYEKITKHRKWDIIVRKC